MGAVVGLIAQDGTEDEPNIHTTQKRRSFLAYSERERAVPWRAVPAYVAWYELQINRNNAAPGREHLDNTKAEDVLDVMSHWKSDMYDRYGIAPSMFVIDDGWDLYGEWTFHAAFPNELRDMASAAMDSHDIGVDDNTLLSLVHLHLELGSRNNVSLTPVNVHAYGKVTVVGDDEGIGIVLLGRA